MLKYLACVKLIAIIFIPYDLVNIFIFCLITVSISYHFLSVDSNMNSALQYDDNLLYTIHCVINISIWGDIET